MRRGEQYQSSPWLLALDSSILLLRHTRLPGHALRLDSLRLGMQKP